MGRIDEAEGRLVGEIVARLLFVRRDLADDGDLAESREPRMQLAPSQAETLEGRRTRRGEEQVGVAELREKLLARGRVFEIEREHRHVFMERPVPRRAAAGERIAVGRLDFRDSRAEIAQAGGGDGAGKVDGQADDFQSGERLEGMRMLVWHRGTPFRRSPKDRRREAGGWSGATAHAHRADLNHASSGAHSHGAIAGLDVISSEGAK